MSQLAGQAAVAVVTPPAKPKVEAKQLKQTDDVLLGNLFKGIDPAILDNTFPVGLSNAVSYWVRLDCPDSLEALIDVLAQGKNATVHRKKGWHAGMCVAIALRVKSGGMPITEAEAPMWNNYLSVVPGLAALILDKSMQRSQVVSAKNGNKKIMFITDQLDATTVKWLAKEWPAAK